MKKILTALAILAFFSISFTACKKDKTKTVAEKIIGTWQIDNIAYNVHTEAIDHITTMISPPLTLTGFEKMALSMPLLGAN